MEGNDIAPRGLWGGQCRNHCTRETQRVCGKWKGLLGCKNQSFICMFSVWNRDLDLGESCQARTQSLWSKLFIGSSGDGMKNKITMERICEEESPWHGYQREAWTAGLACQMKDQQKGSLQKGSHPLARKVSFAMYSSGVRINQHNIVGWYKGERGIQPQKWVYPFTCITSAAEKPLHYAEQVVPGKATGIALAGNGAAGGGQWQSETAAGGGKTREVHPHCLVSGGVSRQPWQRPELHSLSTAARWAQPSWAAVCTHTHKNTHSHTQLCDFRAICISQPEEKWDLLHCSTCGTSFISFSEWKACHINKMSACVSFYCFWMPCKRNTAEHMLFIKILMGRKVYL